MNSERENGQPVRPASEYGEQPAGAGSGQPRAESRSTGPESGGAGDGDRLDAYRDQVLQILARGEDMRAGAIASELALEAPQVSSLLHRLEHDGQVTRTASGSWRLEPAAASRVEPRPSPKEPTQAD